MTPEKRMKVGRGQENYSGLRALVSAYKWILISPVIVVAFFLLLQLLSSFLVEVELGSWQEVGGTIALNILFTLPVLLIGGVGILYLVITYFFLKRGLTMESRPYSYLGLSLATLSSYPLLIALIFSFTENSSRGDISSALPAGERDRDALAYFKSLGGFFNDLIGEHMSFMVGLYIIILFLFVISLVFMFLAYLIGYIVIIVSIPIALVQTFKLKPPALVISPTIKATNSIPEDFSTIKEIYSGKGLHGQTLMELDEADWCRVLLENGVVTGFYYYSMNDGLSFTEILVRGNPDRREYLEKDQAFLISQAS